MDIYWNIHGIQLEYSMHLGLLKMMWLLFPMAPKSRDCFIFSLEKSTINILLEWLEPPARMLQDTTLLIFGLLYVLFKQARFGRLGLGVPALVPPNPELIEFQHDFNGMCSPTNQLKSGAGASRPTGGCIASRKGLTDPATWQDLTYPGYAGRFSWTKHGMGIEPAKMEL